ncbi:MAG: universal stress protein [Thiohalomonadaceae bacterium]
MSAVPPRHIMVASDASPYSAGAVRVAIDMVRQYGGRLTAMSMVPFADDLEAVGTGALLAEQDRLVQSHLDDVVQQAAAAGVPCATVLCHGELPHAEIAAVAEEAEVDLIVMGRRGKRGLAHLMVGDATARVIAHAAANVLVVPRDSGLWCRRLLLATDGAEHSAAAVDAAIGLAQAWRLPLTVVHAVAAGLDMSSAEATVAAICRRAAVLEIDCEARVEAGRADAVIAAVARECGADLIVVGSHGHSGIMSVIHGSVSAQVIGAASCPVLVARGL